MSTTFRRVGATVLAGLTGLAVACAPPGEAAAGDATGIALRAGLEELVTDDGFPGALGSYRDSSGRTVNLVAGVGDLTRKSPPPRDGRVRIASGTKMFTATVVLQLVAEGRVDLAAPVEKYLPGLVPGGEKITVRHLLRHTSGLADYTGFAADILTVRDTYSEPRDLLRMAFAQDPLFAPGTNWRYSNTNYVLAGLIVQKVTGRPVAEEITARVIDRAGLRHTYWPPVGERTIRGDHPHGYTSADHERPGVDITELDPSWGWAAGQLISTPSDVNRFLAALLGGKLLDAARLVEMKQVVEAPGFPPNLRYGLGLMRIELSCGVTAWGHGGDIDGFETRDAITEDGRAVTVTVTALPTREQATTRSAVPADRVVDDVLCA